MDYHLEQLGDERFQKLCQAILVTYYPEVQCLPVGQPDGGRDGFLRIKGKDQGYESTVFQVKFVKNPESRASRDIVQQLIKTEGDKIKRLIEGGATSYHLMTNVSGTSHYAVGSIDKVNEELTSAFGIDTFCWWRDDIARRIDANSSLKWSYPEILKATDLLGDLLNANEDPEKKRRADALRSYMAYQARYDSQLKFKQVDLQKDIVDLFVDIPANFVYPLNEQQRNGQVSLGRISDQDLDGSEIEGSIEEGFYEQSNDDIIDDFGALGMMVKPEFSKTFAKVVIEGAPGQGKSTVTQYLCQVNRLVLLNRSLDIRKVSKLHLPTEARIPFRVDLRDYASWLTGRDPFSDDQSARLVSGSLPLLECFLSAQVNRNTGAAFTVDDLTAISKCSCLLVVLDGFDEVADILLRNRIVSEVSDAADRILENALSLQIIVTSRPAAFANSPGFSRDEWQHLKILPLSRPVIDAYASKWLDGRSIDSRERKEIVALLNEKLAHSHVRDLARNPMQLAILLALISVQGASLPDKRTALYDSYIDIFLNRETEKSVVVRDHRELLVQIHRFLAWTLQSEAEETAGAGNISESRLRIILKEYLEAGGHSTDLVEKLFSGMVERVVALVSRVQGTFEFEVQPLREYFAARYLYDTAPYSPAGVVRSGTLPERFDAIAKNFYWLNVTRFYSGCYSSGELSSLVDGIEELGQSDIFKDVAQSARLGLTLLRDYVFSQQPRLAERLVKNIINSQKFRMILADEWTSSGSRDVVWVPEGLSLARKELISKCLELIGPTIKYDVISAVSKVLTANSDAGFLLEVWRGLKFGCTSEEIVRIGSVFGVYEKMPNDELREFIDEYGASALFAAIRGQRLEIIQGEFGDIHNMYLQHTLDSTGGYFYIPSRRVEQFPVRVSLVLTLEFMSSNFFSSRITELDDVEVFSDVFDIGPAHGLKDVLGSMVATNESEIDAELVGLFGFVKKLYGSPVSELSKNLNLYSEVIESARLIWGERWMLCLLAVRAAEYFKGESVADANIVDSSRSLCVRAVSAKENQFNQLWWERQFELSRTASRVSKRFLLFLVYTWMPAEIMLMLCEPISIALDELSEGEWVRVMGVHGFGGEIEENEGVDYFELGSIDLADSISPRLACLLVCKVGFNSRFVIWEKYLKAYAGSAVLVHDISMNILVERAVKDSRLWVVALEYIRKAYDVGCLSYLHYLRYGSDDRSKSMPPEIAKIICDSPSDYPLGVVSFAERVLTSYAGSMAVPVGRLATSNDWFPCES